MSELGCNQGSDICTIQVVSHSADESPRTTLHESRSSKSSVQFPRTDFSCTSAHMNRGKSDLLVCKTVMERKSHRFHEMIRHLPQNPFRSVFVCCSFRGKQQVHVQRWKACSMVVTAHSEVSEECDESALRNNNNNGFLRRW